MLQFMHFRSVDDNGEIDPRGGATVAFKLDRQNRVKKYAVALCSSNDNYERRRGREIAANRLHDSMLAHVPVVDNPAEFRKVIDMKMRARGLERPLPMRRSTDMVIDRREPPTTSAH